MSAYANAFGSLLPPLPVEENTNKDKIVQKKFETNYEVKKKEESEPEAENAINIKVQSASIDFGIVTGKGISLMPKQPQDFLSIAEAVQFKLLLNYSGRKYTISRSFFQFVELRKSIVKEFRMTKQGKTIPILPIGENSCHDNSNDSMSDLFNDTGLSGFAKVQSLLMYHYCPAMEVIYLFLCVYFFFNRFYCFFRVGSKN